MLIIHDRGVPMTVADLADEVGVCGKDVSDLLRTACRRGHVVRHGRGVYAAGHLPRSTGRTMRGIVTGEH